MTGSRFTKMVVLDFSGTLSLTATLFGHDKNLIRELKAAGLWRMGINRLDIFWNEIINPTWAEGSTTDKGYKHLMFERVRRLSDLLAGRPAESEIWAGVSAFVDSYFKQSVIDPAWQGVIRRILHQPEVLVMVATDHYPEASAHISSQLQLLEIESAPVLRTGGEQRVFVANSADIGYPKASQPFWEALKKARDIQTLDRIVIVDDFGLNEHQPDDYADPEKVSRRQNKTVELLSTVFNAPISVFPFILRYTTTAEDPPAVEHEYQALIYQADRFIQAALAGGHPTIFWHTGQ